MKFSKKEKNKRKKDRKLKEIIDLNGHIKFKPNKENQFDSLVGIVISQFISTSAANTIFNNIRKNFDTKFLNESNFSNLTIDNIKKLGLRINKAKKIKDISNIYFSKSFVKLSELNNEELHKTLLSVFGIGPWSINMFEIFC